MAGAGQRHQQLDARPAAGQVIEDVAEQAPESRVDLGRRAGQEPAHLEGVELELGGQSVQRQRDSHRGRVLPEHDAVGLLLGRRRQPQPPRPRLAGRRRPVAPAPAHRSTTVPANRAGERSRYAPSGAAPPHRARDAPSAAPSADLVCGERPRGAAFIHRSPRGRDFRTTARRPRRPATRARRARDAGVRAAASPARSRAPTPPEPRCHPFAPGSGARR